MLGIADRPVRSGLDIIRELVIHIAAGAKVNDLHLGNGAEKVQECRIEYNLCTMALRAMVVVPLLGSCRLSTVSTKALANH